MCVPRLRLLCLFLLLASPLCCAAQTQPAAQNDSPADSTTDGTAEISGHILSTETGQPIEKATINLFPLNNTTQPKTTITAADGSYRIGWIAKGIYNLTASRDGFVTQTYRNPNDPSTSTNILDVPDAAVLTSIDISLPSAASVHGIILDASGDPVGQDVSISAVPAAADPNVPNLTVKTDAGGHFTFNRLAPGIYLLCVNGPSLFDVSPSKANITYRQTWLGDTPNRSDAQPVEVRVGDPGPDLRIVAPRLTGHTLTITPIWPASSPAKPDHLTATLNNGTYQATFNPDGSATITNLPAGKYRAHVSAFQDSHLIGEGDDYLFTMAATDAHVQVKLKPTNPDAPAETTNPPQK